MFFVLQAAGPACAQGNCPPQSLPWFEDFESGFVWNNGWIRTTLDTTFFEYDHCWMHGFRHYCGWESMISFEYLSVTPSVIRNNLLDIEKSYWDFNGTEPGLKYAATPQFAESPSLVTFKAYCVLALIHPSTIGGVYRDTVFSNGLMVSIGYVADEADPLDSYVPLDTVYVASHNALSKTFCCSNLGGVVIPPPLRLEFRVAEPMSDWRGTIICYIDSISVTNGTLPTDTTDYYDTVCVGENYSGYGFSVLGDTIVGTRIYSRDSVFDCHRDLFLLHLAVLPPPTDTSDYYDTVCAGETYSGYGFFVPDNTVAGTYVFSRDSVANCHRDLFLLHLTVLPSVFSEHYASMQEGDTLVFADTTITAPGTYHFYYAAANGCDSVVTLHVTDCAPNICVTVNRDFVDFDYPLLILTNCTDSVTMSRWTFNDGYTYNGSQCRRQIHLPMTDSVSVTLSTCNSLGCCADTTLTFGLQIRSIWFPNVFTPDEDGNNRFGCVTSCEVSEYELMVFNRWGLWVWSTTDINNRWDGCRDGRPLPQGAYVYRWRLKDVQGERWHGEGIVTLIR